MHTLHGSVALVIFPLAQYSAAQAARHAAPLQQSHDATAILNVTKPSAWACWQQVAQLAPVDCDAQD